MVEFLAYTYLLMYSNMTGIRRFSGTYNFRAIDMYLLLSFTKNCDPGGEASFVVTKTRTAMCRLDNVAPITQDMFEHICMPMVQLGLHVRNVE